MEILKALVFFTDDESGTLFTCDVVMRDGKAWLVPKWIGTPNNPKKYPERFICIENLPHQKIDNPHPHHYVVNAGIPKCVFQGIQPKESQQEFIIEENVNIPARPGTH